MSTEKSQLKHFIKNNMVSIMSTKFSSNEEVKRLKVDYFVHQRKRKFGVPKDKEIAEEAIKYLIEIKKITKENIKDSLQKCPFIKDNIDIENIEYLFEETTKLGDSILKPEDLKNLNQTDFLKKKEEEIKQKAIVEIEEEKRRTLLEISKELDQKYRTEFENLEMQRKEMEKEKNEIQKLKSEIEDYDVPSIIKSFPKTEIKDATDTTIESDWWMKIGLFQNPFPSMDGFSKIDKKFFDSIVLMTPIFKKYYNLINDNLIEFMDKSYIVTGEFGSGKTTLFDYLSKPLINFGMYPIIILLDAEPDSNKIKRQFFRSILEEVKNKYLELFSVDPRTIFTEYSKIELAEILNNILSTGHFKGFTIFIDGLHKDGEYFQQVKEFIRGLQNTKDFFTRKEIPVTIFIAGSKRWELDLKSSPSTSGSIYSMDKIDAISIDDAHAMVNNRLRTFSIDQDKPTKVDRSSIEKIFVNLQHRLTREVSFRDIIDEVLPPLRNADSNVVRLSLKYDKDLLIELKGEIEKNYPEFLLSINRMLDLIHERPYIFERLIRMLAKIYDYGGVEQNVDLYNKNKNIFAILFKAGLIRKTRYKGHIKWIPDKMFMNAAYNLKKKMRANLSELLIDLFAPSQIEEKTIQYIDEDIKDLTQLVNSLEDTLPKSSESLKQTIELHKKIKEHHKSPTDIIPSEKIIENTNNSINHMINALLWIADGRGLTDWDLEVIKNRLSNSWINVPALQEYWDHLDFLKMKGITIDSRQGREIIVYYSRAFSSLKDVIKLFTSCNPILNLQSINLTKLDKRNLHQAREKFLTNQYQKCARIVNDLLEEKLRNFIYGILCIKFGDKWKTRLGDLPNKYIHDQKENRMKTVLTDDSECKNDLYYASRGHYQMIIAGDDHLGKENWTLVFEKCFEEEGLTGVKETLSLYKLIADPDKHNMQDFWFNKNSDKILMLLQKSKKLIESINQSYLKILSPENIIIEDDNNVLFSFRSGSDKSNLKSVYVDKEEGKNIVRKLSEGIATGRIKTFDLLDINSIEYDFSTKYRIFFGVIGIAIKKSKIALEPYEGCVVRISLKKEEP